MVEPSDEQSGAVDETVVGEGDLEPEELPESRARMRMTIDQLQASMKHITGVDWMSGNKLLWEEYRTSLGVPDYEETVNEDPLPMSSSKSSFKMPPPILAKNG